MTRIHSSKRRAAAAAAASLVAALSGGCASAPPPTDFDPSRLRIVAMDAPPMLEVSGLPGGKGAGLGVGAGAGGGYGALAGALACLPAGPFIGACLAIVLPTTTSVGAVTGAAVGAARTESVEALKLKTQALGAEMKSTPYHELLGRQLSDRLAAYPAVAAPTGRPWTLEVGIVEVGTEGKSDFALRLLASVKARREGSAVVVWEAQREVQSESELTIAQWLANDAAALRGVTARCIDRAAEQLAHELKRGSGGTSARAASRRSASCDDEPTQWARAAAAPDATASAPKPPPEAL